VNGGSGGGRSTFNIGFKAVLVIILLAIAVSTFLAFVNGYPALGWFGFGVFGFAICLWILLAGTRGTAGTVATVILCICALIAVFAYLSGVQSEWYRLTNQTKSGMQQKQEIPPKYFVLIDKRS
jgi:hypothetical protein